MMNMVHTLTIAAAGSLLLGACEGVPTAAPEVEARFAGVERTVHEVLYEMKDSNFAFGCSADGEVLPPGEGELVAMEGQIYERTVLLQSANGEHHFSVHTMPVDLRGFGVDSGEEFRVSEREHTVANTLMGSGSASYRSELKMVGTETQRTFWMVFNGVIRFGFDGELQVYRDEGRIECRAGTMS